MRMPSTVLAFLVSGFAGWLTAASAMPPINAVPPVPVTGLLRLAACDIDQRALQGTVSGGRVATDCDRPVARQPAGNAVRRGIPPIDCHRDVRRHRIPGTGERFAHRHIGEDCRISRVYRSN